MAIKVHNAIQFVDKLSMFDGEAKWYIRNGDVFIADISTDANASFPRGVQWDYAFSDEPDCINWEKMGFEPPPSELFSG